MNQASVVSDMKRSGWEIDIVRDGFLVLCRRTREKGESYWDYEDCTVFPNGRTAEGEFNKYPRRMNP